MEKQAFGSSLRQNCPKLLPLENDEELPRMSWDYMNWVTNSVAHSGYEEFLWDSSEQDVSGLNRLCPLGLLVWLLCFS